MSRSHDSNAASGTLRASGFAENAIFFGFLRVCVCEANNILLKLIISPLLSFLLCIYVVVLFF